MATPESEPRPDRAEIPNRVVYASLGIMAACVAATVGLIAAGAPPIWFAAAVLCAPILGGAIGYLVGPYEVRRA